MAPNPMISVILPVFNAERFLKPAIQSILDQSFKDFELIIVEDGSKDRSFEISDNFRKLDSRIELIRLTINQGVANASNIALQNAGGRYIARMDSDDISLPERFSKQAEFMETHPDVGILGCGMQYMDESGRLLSIPPLFQGDLSIRWHSFFESPFFNPTVMIRKSVLDMHDLRYDTSSIRGEEDYELWSRLLPLTKGVNLPDILLHYRLHQNSITHIHRDELSKRERIIAIAVRATRNILPELSTSEEDVTGLVKAIWGIGPFKKQRAYYLPVYFAIWQDFCRKYHGRPGLRSIELEVLAWAARMFLYPLFQRHSFKGFWLLTKRDWTWPLILISHIPYFLARRRIG